MCLPSIVAVLSMRERLDSVRTVSRLANFFTFQISVGLTHLGEREAKKSIKMIEIFIQIFMHIQNNSDSIRNFLI